MPEMVLCNLSEMCVGTAACCNVIGYPSSTLECLLLPQSPNYAWSSYLALGSIQLVMGLVPTSTGPFLVLTRHRVLWMCCTAHLQHPAPVLEVSASVDPVPD